MEAIIVPCTQEKIWDANPDAGLVPAKDAYTKREFVGWRAYAERSGCPWFILSTRYGLITPDHQIERYDVPISTAVKNQSLLKKLKEQGNDLDIGQFDRVVLLDWAKFEPLVRAAVDGRSVECLRRPLFYKEASESEDFRVTF